MGLPPLLSLPFLHSIIHGNESQTRRGGEQEREEREGNSLTFMEHEELPRPTKNAIFLAMVREREGDRVGEKGGKTFFLSTPEERRSRRRKKGGGGERQYMFSVIPGLAGEKREEEEEGRRERERKKGRKEDAFFLTPTGNIIPPSSPPPPSLQLSFSFRERDREREREKGKGCKEFTECHQCRLEKKGGFSPVQVNIVIFADVCSKFFL